MYIFKEGVVVNLNHVANFLLHENKIKFCLPFMVEKINEQAYWELFFENKEEAEKSFYKILECLLKDLPVCDLNFIKEE